MPGTEEQRLKIADPSDTQPKRRDERQVAPVAPPRCRTGAVHVDADVVRVVQEVLSGEMETVEITPDMVGKRVAFHGKAFILPECEKSMAAAQEAPNVARDKGSRNSYIDDLIMDELLRARDAGDPPILVDELARHFIELDVYKNKRSATNSLSKRLGKLESKGLFSRTRVGNTLAVQAN